MNRRPGTGRARTVGLLVTLLAPVTACGDPGQDYCASLKERNQAIAEMIESDSPAALLNGLPMLRELAEEAPSDLRDEWQVFLGALEGLEEAIEKSGAEPGRLQGRRAAARAERGRAVAVAEAADQIGAEDVVQSASGIELQARDVCKVNLGLS